MNDHRAAPPRDTWGLKPCDKPDCVRWVKAGIKYCCGPCGLADHCGAELADREDVNAHPALRHSPGCDERDKERCPKANAHEQDGGL